MYVHIHRPEPPEATERPMAKKSFKDNPALHFITRPEAAAEPPNSRPPEAPLKPNPLYVETKSKRVQLLMRPALHARLKAEAAARGQSLNDLIHTVLSDWVSDSD